MNPTGGGSVVGCKVACTVHYSTVQYMHVLCTSNKCNTVQVRELAVRLAFWVRERALGTLYSVSRIIDSLGKVVPGGLTAYIRVGWVVVSYCMYQRCFLLVGVVLV